MRMSLWIAFAAMSTALIASCGGDDDSDVTGGTIVFTANGEDFVRNGFTSKDGWALSFDHVYAVIGGPTAFQVPDESGGAGKISRHAGHPHVGLTSGGAHAALTGTFVVDLKQGDGPATIGEIKGVEAGNYNRIAWDLKTCDAQSAVPVSPVTADDLGIVHGYCLVLSGSASKGAVTKNFVIRFNEPIYWVSTEAHQDDIGIVPLGGTGFAEMTFHLDHVFGDSSSGPTEGVNPGAVGFDPFAALDQDSDDDLYVDGRVMELYMPAGVCRQLYRAFVTLGHSGESHCMFMPGGSGAGHGEEAGEEPVYPVGAAGTLEFTANGEEFVRNGFTTVDGWDIAFSHFYICIKNPVAFRQSTGVTDSGSTVHLDAAGLGTDAYVIDLAQGTGATVIGQRAGVEAGHYSRISWEMKDIEDTDSAVSPVNAGDVAALVASAPVAGKPGCAILIGTAQKPGPVTVDFVLRVSDVLGYMSTGPHQDNIGRLLTNGGTAQAEMTFHADHIFGDHDTIDEWDSVNAGALGFGPLAAMDGTSADHDGAPGSIDVYDSGLPGASDILAFYKAWITLGHSGETHAMVAVGGE